MEPKTQKTVSLATLKAKTGEMAQRMGKPDREHGVIFQDLKRRHEDRGYTIV